MPSPKRPRVVRKRRVSPYSGRGPIYAWLRTHAEEVRAFRHHEQRPWSLLIPDMVDDGVLDASGQPPSQHNVSTIWQRVARDVAACQAAAAALPKT